MHLLMSPIGRNRDSRIDITGDAPISQWTLVEAYDSASDWKTGTETAANQVLEHMHNGAKPEEENPDAEQLLHENLGMELPHVITTHTQSIAGDDPRLKP